MFGWLTIDLLLVILNFNNVEVGNATVFYAKGDKYNPNPHAACLGRDLDDEKDFIIAHRTLPCGTKVTIVNLENGLRVEAKVGDRGPYGRTTKGNYRGIVDLSNLVNRALKARGRAIVAIIKPKPKTKQIIRNDINVNYASTGKCDPEVCWSDE